MSPLTPRELRIIADHVERLTKARVVNTQLGIDTTPDTISIDFPNGYTGTAIWMPGVHSDDPKRRQRIAQHARHRDCYQLDVATITASSTAHAEAQANIIRNCNGVNAADLINAVKRGPTLYVTQEKLCDEGACQHDNHPADTGPVPTQQNSA
jgi:hypothetical protein